MGGALHLVQQGADWVVYQPVNPLITTKTTTTTITGTSI